MGDSQTGPFQWAVDLEGSFRPHTALSSGCLEQRERGVTHRDCNIWVTLALRIYTALAPLPDGNKSVVDASLFLKSE